MSYICTTHADKKKTPDEPASSCREVEGYFTENVVHSGASFVRGDKFDELRRVRADAMAVVKKMANISQDKIVMNTVT